MALLIAGLVAGVLLHANGVAARARRRADLLDQARLALQCAAADVRLGLPVEDTAAGRVSSASVETESGTNTLLWRRLDVTPAGRPPVRASVCVREQ
ncbi:MAG: hypothetical protein JXR37_31310 [Kiritimatiellae bacterium]|nr:hypothetical protein [Kiritimatiellia bacterium]